MNNEYYANIVEQNFLKKTSLIECSMNLISTAFSKKYKSKNKALLVTIGVLSLLLSVPLTIKSQAIKETYNLIKEFEHPIKVDMIKGIQDDIMYKANYPLALQTDMEKKTSLTCSINYISAITNKNYDIKSKIVLFNIGLISLALTLPLTIISQTIKKIHKGNRKIENALKKEIVKIIEENKIG